MLSKRLVRIGTFVAVTTVAGAASAAYTTVNGKTYGAYCPSHIGGDKDFNDNGPDVFSTLTLERRNGNREIWVNFYLYEIEQIWDWTECELSKSVKIATAPIGFTYTKIWLNGAWVNLGSSPTIGVADVSYTDTDWAVDTFNNPDWWVSSIQIVGDTQGNDVGACTSDDASLKATLPTLYFWYE